MVNSGIETVQQLLRTILECLKDPNNIVLWSYGDLVCREQMGHVHGVVGFPEKHRMHWLRHLLPHRTHPHPETHQSDLGKKRSAHNNQ